MRLVYVNPNSTTEMTDKILAAARAALPEADIEGRTNLDGPPAIEGAASGAAAVPGVLRLIEAEAGRADAVVIACFDDTGLEAAQRSAPCPVLGIGRSAFVMAGLLGLRFSVVTSLDVSIPVIRENIEGGGFAAACASVRASGLPVLEIDRGGPDVIGVLSRSIAQCRDEDAAEAVVLGCAGMAPLAPVLANETRLRLIDGVAASAHLAAAVAAYGRG